MLHADHKAICTTAACIYEVGLARDPCNAGLLQDTSGMSSRYNYTGYPAYASGSDSESDAPQNLGQQVTILTDLS